jgi:predicted nuclease with RNAse H fold
VDLGSPRWAGVDVGGRRKGFHLAAVDTAGRVMGPVNRKTVSAAADWIDGLEPAIVALDSPVTTAPPGETCREGERRLRADICGIRWTPDPAAMDGNPYYEWIQHGLELYEDLRERGHMPIEVFPTASWTRWAGKRRGTRAAWTATALTQFGLAGLPPRLSQDGRDAIAAALTARLYARGETEPYDEIAVPMDV